MKDKLFEDIHVHLSTLVSSMGSLQYCIQGSIWQFIHLLDKEGMDAIESVSAECAELIHICFCEMLLFAYEVIFHEEHNALYSQADVYLTRVTQGALLNTL